MEKAENEEKEIILIKAPETGPFLSYPSNSPSIDFNITVNPFVSFSRDLLVKNPNALVLFWYSILLVSTEYPTGIYLVSRSKK